MTRLILFLLAILGLSAGFSWLADNPGTITVDWQGYHAEPTVFQVVVLTAVLTALGICAWSILRQIWTSPAAISHFLTKRRQQRGLDALSSGMIAIGAGDKATATRYALQARKSLPNEPLTHLLRAQAAQLSGDRATSRRIFEAMLSAPDTEQLGLRGLYLEAAREGEIEAQRQFAERAIALNPKLSWPVEGLFDLQCRDGNWGAALETLNVARRQGTFEKPVMDRRRAVLLTGQAMALEDSQADKALGLALEAHGLAKDLVPAAVIAGRLLAARGNTAKAAKVLQKTWARSPHPDIAAVYAYARIGDSPRDRLDRVKQLAALTPHSSEGPIAVATVAIEARDFEQARDALSLLLEGRLTRRVATLMARIEKEEHGDKGRVRQWLARAVHAPRDPAWTADGVVSDTWAPASPVTGALDAFQWRVPVDEPDMAASLTGTSSSLDDLIALDSVIDSMTDDSVSIDAVAVETPGTSQKAATHSSEPVSVAAAARKPEEAGAGAGGRNPREVVQVASQTGTAKRVQARVDIKAATEAAVQPPPSRAAQPSYANKGHGVDAVEAGIEAVDSAGGSSGLARKAEAKPAPLHAVAAKGAGASEDAEVMSRTAKPQRTAAPKPPIDQKQASILIKQPADTGSDLAERPKSGAQKTAGAGHVSGQTPGKPRAEPSEVVPLHAPDDPGPDADDGDDVVEQQRAWPYRLS